MTFTKNKTKWLAVLAFGEWFPTTGDSSSKAKFSLWHSLILKVRKNQPTTSGWSHPSTHIIHIDASSIHSDEDGRGAMGGSGRRSSLCFAPTHLIRAIFYFGFCPFFTLCADIVLAVVMASQMSPISIAKIHQFSVPADNNRVFGSSFGSFFSGLATGNRLHLKNSGCRGFPLSSQRLKRSIIIKSLVRIFL